MDFRDIVLEDASDFLRRSLAGTPGVAAAFDPDDGAAQVRVEVRVTVDNGTSYAKMPFSQELHILNGDWYATERAAEDAKWGGEPLPL